MTRRLALPVFLIGALTLGGCAMPPATNDPADLAAVAKLRDQFMQTFAGGDAAAVGNLYTTDAIYAQNHQPTNTGRDAIVKTLAGLFSQFSVKLTLMPDATKTMGDFAYDWGHYTFALTPKTAGAPAPPVDEGRYLVLIRKDTDGQWRVSNDIGNSSLPMPMAMPMPAPPPTKAGK